MSANTKAAFLIIPAKRGRGGHPKITIEIWRRRTGYEVAGYTKDFFFTARNKSIEDGVNHILEVIFNNLEERRNSKRNK